MTDSPTSKKNTTIVITTEKKKKKTPDLTPDEVQVKAVKIGATLDPNLFSIPDVSVVKRIPERAQRNCLFKACYLICTHYLFTLIITLLIIVNTIVLAFDSYPEDKELSEIAM